MSFRLPGGDGPEPFGLEIFGHRSSFALAHRARHACLALAAVALCSVFSAEAVTITAKGGTGFLNRKQSWIGNNVPTFNDIALWNTSSGGTTAGLGSNMSWLGIRITSPSGGVTFNLGNTLTLGSSGIDMSAATVNFTINCAVSIAAAQTWSVNTGQILAANTTVSGTGGITKTGGGMLYLRGTNSYTGSTTINGGTLSISTAAALGNGTGALTINPTGTLQTTGTFSTARNVVLGGTGGATSGGTFDVTGTTEHTRTGVISGTGSLIKTGTGTLTLNGSNTFTGDVYINGGTVVAGSITALGPQPAAGSSAYATHMANGTTLRTTTTSTGGNRQLDLMSGTATLDVVSATTQQRNGLVYGAGGMVKSGAGTLILTNANTYSGGTTINAGTLQVNNLTGSGTGSGAVTVNSGGTLSGLPTATGFANAGRIAGTVTVNGGGALIARSGGTFTFGGLVLNASSSSTFQLGVPTDTAIINITGLNGLSLAGTSTVNILNIGGLAEGTYRLFDYNGTPLTNIANLQLGSTAGGGFTYSLSNNQTDTSIDLLVSTSNQQWANDANGTWGAGSNWTNGAAPNGVGGQANFFGTINQARTVTVDGAFTVGTMTFNNLASYTIEGSGTNGHGLTLNNGGQATIAVLSGSHTISAPLALANSLQIVANSGTALTLSGVLSGSSTSWTLSSDGTGVVTFSGNAANTYGGLTTVAAGNLNLNKTAGVNAIGTGGLQVNAGATTTLLASNQVADTATALVNGTLALGSSSETIGALNGAGSVTTAAGGVLTVGASNNLTSQFDGTISGGGTITKSGAGTFVLSGANSFGGSGQTVAINNGTLRVWSDTSLGHAANSITFNGGTLSLATGVTSGRNIVLNANATLDTDVNTGTFSGVISGAGSLTKSGSGTLNLSGANTYTGGSTINSGTVVVNNANSLGASTGAATLNDATIQVASGFTSNRNFALNHSGSTLEVKAGQTFTASGVLSGAGALNKTGDGTMALTKANTFTGATVVDAGTLTAAATSGSALATTSSVTVNNGGTLLLGASNQVNNTAPVTLAGGTIAKGNFSEGSTSTAGFGALTLAADSTLDFGSATGTLTFASFNPDSYSLLINNWSGTANTIGSGTTDRLIFNGDQSANLSLFSFSGYQDGAAQFRIGNTQFYEVVPMTPVPEPSTYAAAALALLGIGFQQRARLRRLLHRRTVNP